MTAYKVNNLGVNQLPFLSEPTKVQSIIVCAGNDLIESERVAYTYFDLFGDVGGL